jgi:hypothetical protein
MPLKDGTQVFRRDSRPVGIIHHFLSHLSSSLFKSILHFKNRVIIALKEEKEYQKNRVRLYEIDHTRGLGQIKGKNIC